jgi:uncharacterized protein (TIRG00374 family)
MNKKTIIRNSILVVVLLLVVIGFIVFYNDFDQIVVAIKNIEIKYVIYSALATILFWVTWSLSLVFILKQYPSKLANADFFLVGCCDLFFNGITPFSSGGQPFQIYFLNKGSMKASNATSAIISKSIIYQVSLVLLSVFGLIIGYKKIVSEVNYFIILIISGISINLLILVILIVASTWKKSNKLFLKIFISFGKIKIFKKFVERKKATFERYLTDFQSSFINLIKNPKCLYISLFFQLMSMLLQFAIPYFLIKSFLNYDVSILYVLSLSALNSSFSSIIPTPGASGGAEYGLQVLLLTISGVTMSVAAVVMLISRVFTYYLTMLFGVVTYLILDKRLIKKEVESRVIHWGDNL